ncbi:unnamed protein product [Lota lota]
MISRRYEGSCDSTPSGGGGPDPTGVRGGPGDPAGQSLNPQPGCHQRGPTQAGSTPRLARDRAPVPGLTPPPRDPRPLQVQDPKP